MKIGVFSDIHDNLGNLKLCLAYLKEKDVKSALFCGDFCSPIPVKKVISTFPEIEIHAVFGNTEDRHLITQLALTDVKHLKIYGEFAELQFEERKIALTHYPIYAEALAHTGRYDACFHGHNHTASETQVDKCLIVNPGEILGAFEDSSFAIYNTEGNTIERIFIKDLGSFEK